jgi:REP element-mobilizing transposase RayT
MTRARREQICLDATPYYHVVSRCVRRAFLCGDDAYSQQNFDHRRQWVVDRLQQLCRVFAIDMAAYAVMSNHYHLVLRIDREQAMAWSTDEVIERWYALFNGHLLVDRLKAGQVLGRAERRAASLLVEQWRTRLHDLGWFMRCLNEHIARQANTEDGCTGRFWEGRYKSQALLNETALLTCMTYVDLNPIRAGMAKTPETSDFTSLQARIKALLKGTSNDDAVPLLTFGGDDHVEIPADALPMHLDDYLTLVDWTGRSQRQDKRGAIPEGLPPIFERLSMSAEQWLEAVAKASHRYGLAKGPLERIQAYAEQLGKRWIRGQSLCRCFYRPAPT